MTPLATLWPGFSRCLLTLWTIQPFPTCKVDVVKQVGVSVFALQEHSGRQTAFNSKGNGFKDIKQGLECASRSVTFPIRSIPLNQLLPVACQHPGAAELEDWACDSLSTCTLQNFVQLAGTWKKMINRERSYFFPFSGLKAKQHPLFFSFFPEGLFHSFLNIHLQRLQSASIKKNMMEHLYNKPVTHPVIFHIPIVIIWNLYAWRWFFLPPNPEAIFSVDLSLCVCSLRCLLPWTKWGHQFSVTAWLQSLGLWTSQHLLECTVLWFMLYDFVLLSTQMISRVKNWHELTRTLRDWSYS